MNNKRWIIIFTAALAVCLSISAGLKYIGRDAAAAIVAVDGDVVKTVDLSVKEPYEFDVKTKNGGYNRIRVENGKICVVEANCPDKLCVKQGIAEYGIPVVCLPNKLSVSISGGRNLR